MSPTLPALLLAADTFQVVNSLIVSSAGPQSDAWLRACRLFDSAGAAWEIAELCPSPVAPPAKRLFGKTLHSVELVVAGAKPYDVSALAVQLCALVDRDPDDLYSQWVPHDRLKELLRGASTPAGLVQTAARLGRDEDAV